MLYFYSGFFNYSYKTHYIFKYFNVFFNFETNQIILKKYFTCCSCMDPFVCINNAYEFYNFTTYNFVVL